MVENHFKSLILQLCERSEQRCSCGVRFARNVVKGDFFVIFKHCADISFSSFLLTSFFHLFLQSHLRFGFHTWWVIFTFWFGGWNSEDLVPWKSAWFWGLWQCDFAQFRACFWPQVFGRQYILHRCYRWNEFITCKN